MFSVQEIIEKKLLSEQKDRPVTAWYSSGLGGDLVSRYLERKGVKADEEFDLRTLRVFAVGRYFEDWLTGLVGKEGENETQVSVAWPEMDLRGRADQVFKNPSVVYEYKTMHSRGFWHMEKEGVQGKLQHRMQLWTYLHVLKIDEGRLVYFSKDDLSIAEFQVLREDKELEKLVIDELTILNESWKAQLPPPPIVWSNGEWVKMKKDDWQAKYNRYQKQIFTQPKYFDVRKLKLNYKVNI